MRRIFCMSRPTDLRQVLLLTSLSLDVNMMEKSGLRSDSRRCSRRQHQQHQQCHRLCYGGLASSTTNLVSVFTVTVGLLLLLLMTPTTMFSGQNTVHGFYQQSTSLSSMTSPTRNYLMRLSTTTTTTTRIQQHLQQSPKCNNNSNLYSTNRHNHDDSNNHHDDHVTIMGTIKGERYSLLPHYQSSSSSSSSIVSRRRAGASIFGSTMAALVLPSMTTVSLSPLPQANAAVTDETDNFADNWWITPKGGDDEPGTSPSSSSSSSPKQKQKQKQSTATPSDEIRIVVSQQDLQSKDGLGLELGEVEFRTNRRVYVKSVTPNSIADRLGIQPNWIVVAINGQTAERTNVEGVAIMVYRAARATTTTSAAADGTAMVELTFRDPAIFRDRLRAMSSSTSSTSSLEDDNSPKTTVTTQIAPAGDTTQRRQQDGSVRFGQSVTSQDDQRLTVSQLIPPKLCTRGATTDDLLEISYIGRVYETGTIFDGSAVMINGEGIAGRGNDVSIFFVLGKQPFGQFPPGWDVGLDGICVGERRRLLVPPALGYGSTGLPRRGIPPNATLQYDVTLVSLNGLATPQ